MRASLIAASLASAPELQKYTLPPRLELDRLLREAHRGLAVEQVADVDQRTRLLGDRGDDLGVAVAEARDRDAAEEVEVLVALRVPQARALAAYELDGLARVGGDHARALELLQLGEAHAETSIFVPTPASVNSSSSSECAIRPSMM